MTFNWDVDTATAKPATLELKGRRVLVTRKDELIGVADLAEADGLKEEISEGTLTLKGTLAGKSRARCLVYLPGWEMKPAAEASLADAATLLEQTKDYWQRLIGTGTQFDLPDPQVKNLILSSIVHCWLTARNREGGKLVEPWIAPNCYGALDSESQVITRGMDAWGQHEYATKSLEFWLGRCPAGFFVSGYTYGPGTGQFLWTLMDHYQLTRDKAWMKKFMPQITTVCKYIAGQTEKTKRLDVAGRENARVRPDDARPRGGLGTLGLHLQDQRALLCRTEQGGADAGGVRRARGRGLGQERRTDARRDPAGVPLDASPHARAAVARWNLGAGVFLRGLCDRSHRTVLPQFQHLAVRHIARAGSIWGLKACSIRAAKR